MKDEHSYKDQGIQSPFNSSSHKGYSTLTCATFWTSTISYLWEASPSLPQPCPASLSLTPGLPSSYHHHRLPASGFNCMAISASASASSWLFSPPSPNASHVLQSHEGKKPGRMMRTSHIFEDAEWQSLGIPHKYATSPLEYSTLRDIPPSSSLTCVRSSLSRFRHNLAKVLISFAYLVIVEARLLME
jgi:hypothetical protein